MGDKSQIWKILIHAGHLYEYWSFKYVSSSIKQVKTDSNWLYIIQIGQELSVYDTIISEMGHMKYPILFGCPRFEQTYIRVNSDAKELIKQISKYVWIEEKPWICIRILFVSHFIWTLEY